MARLYQIDPESRTPDEALPVDPEFVNEYRFAVNEGANVASRLSVCFVGMARDIAGILPFNLRRLEKIGSKFRQWRAVVVENDSIDGTKEILRDWESRAGTLVRCAGVVCDCRDLGRERLSGFEPARVERYAEYRCRYRDLAAKLTKDDPVDLVIAVDLDPWGGWSEEGVLSGVYWMSDREYSSSAAGMASVSLYEQRVGSAFDELILNRGSMLLHYDQWAWRDVGWRCRWDKHFPLWLPPVGSPPIRCNSAFGALCIYRPEPFFKNSPVSIDGDIEHVGLHREMADCGWEFYLNPSQRSLMHWLPQEREAVDSRD